MELNQRSSKHKEGNMVPQQTRSKIILFRVLFSVVLGLAMCYLFVLLSSTSAMSPQNTNSLAPASSRITFTKDTSNLTPRVGEVFSFTLAFNTAATETLPIQVRMTDQNPAPTYLEILKIEGGAEYSPTIDAVVWEGMLQPAGALPQKVTVQMKVTSIPPGALPDGYEVTNTAWIADLATPGSLPETMAEITIRLMPASNFLPLIRKDYDG